MERGEDITEEPLTQPVFVDDTGRRRALARRAGRLLVVGFVGYLGLLGAGFTHDTHLGPLSLPTFGLPSLVHAPTPPATVLGQSTSRGPSDVVEAGGSPGTPKGNMTVDSSRRGARAPGATTGNETGPAPATPVDPAPATAPEPGQPVTTPSTTPTSTTATTAPAPTSGHGEASTTTTTAPAPTTSTTDPSSTTTTTTPTTSPGQASGATSGRGPGGNGAPGQLRRPTTTTTA